MAAKRRYADRHVGKRTAHVALHNAVRDGRIAKKPCLVCETTERVQGHHFDYSRPLDVVWLCAQHHSAFHKIEREIQRMEAKAA
ncbi:MAG TPA: hypothetical protein DDW98_08975 [Gammaproteobacteria bacterium]|nr:hypothetical protein [Gammaproteobacteria bacterium]